MCFIAQIAHLGESHKGQVKLFGGSDHLRVKNCEKPSQREIPAKIGAPKKNDNNVETVRDRAKLCTRHPYGAVD